MSLQVVSTPIGNIDDITLRAISILKNAEVIIGEEFREVTTLLKRLDIPKPQLERLNEHSKEDDILELAELCKTKTVALVSDCGTPGFCDPGANLIALCYKNKVMVTPAPGASSLMSLLSLYPKRLNKFIFQGFLPAKKEERLIALEKVKKEKTPQIIMDTPYRLGRLLNDIYTIDPNRRIFIGVNMTTENEVYLYDTIKNIQKKLEGQKAEFVLLLEEA